jgi:alkylated DNA repair protein (DNA oxidative demethylase)
MATPIIVQSVQPLRDDFFLLARFVQTSQLIDLIDAVQSISEFRHMSVPGGKKMSVAMTNCGEVGWVSDSSGYRYDPIDPQTGDPWPAMPAEFSELAMQASKQAGFGSFRPDCCLINRYEQGTRLSLHKDSDEAHFEHPIVSVSIGASARFVVGGLARKDKTQGLMVNDGDVLVWGGKSRLIHHGVGSPRSHVNNAQLRFNLTFRRAL